MYLIRYCEFQLIVFNEVIKHLGINPIFSLKKINRVLKPKKKLILTTPNLYSLNNILIYIKGRGLNNPYKEFKKIYDIGHLGHLREYSPYEIKKNLNNTDFNIISVNYFNIKKNSKTTFNFSEKLSNIIYYFFPKIRPYQIIISEKK